MGCVLVLVKWCVCTVGEICGRFVCLDVFVECSVCSAMNIWNIPRRLFSRYYYAVLIGLLWNSFPYEITLVSLHTL